MNVFKSNRIVLKYEHFVSSKIPNMHFVLDPKTILIETLNFKIVYTICKTNTNSLFQRRRRTVWWEKLKFTWFFLHMHRKVSTL